MAIRYVVHHKNGWCVKNANGEKAIKTFGTQEEAIKFARSLNDTTSIKIQSRDGSFRK
ncbi:DUF2188 domain-containing protein [Metamycoplasma hyosynoviae]|uniref:DUF2188 domain-containing protein n=1 Tax=Metamycoplasma hyosynoviae TaxID=29559 RepID=A0A4V3FMF6_9BACT|nr:DUF2188 domain-containing protein [Metamycoplasma hyosynoviae]MDC8900264.1 DUF2188 domain-containing protein [Metamycoplasma hyosynoviae]MDC8901122.1 DUF2188 domain-containing protein [Metamycoplasma hyosynoviae]MDC8911895.1 DUF2188 domain-containing protein [Metamycoplasma hyosynoviae]MDC8912482.1 DUF2188 domain-containing protein [Metamycoplasma hyosynoviae]MDC8913215.1 DUF2188 domain-containing protein [Metamycoplasma hyosynoviae]